MKKVLFIAYNFPPCGGPGVQRSLKYVKYLEGTNWQPIVFTTYEDSYPVLDFSLLKDIPEGTLIYRTKTYDINKYRLYFVKLGLGKFHALLNTLLALPDSAIFWALFSRYKIKRIIQEHEPDIIYTSSGPYSSHLLGLWIKIKYNIPWVADFRDAWSLNQFVKYLPLYRKFNSILEKKVLDNADSVVCVSEVDCRNFSILANNSDKVEVIHNGFDHDNFPNFGKIVNFKSDKFTILYTGNFSSTRKPDNFINAIRKLIDENKIDERLIEVIFAGSSLDRFLPDYPFIDNVGYIEHSNLENLRNKSHLLLLLQDSSISTIGDYSGKIFEYIASGIPILAITNPNSVVVNLVNSTKTGITVDSDVISISRIILKLYNNFINCDLDFAPNWDEVNRYSRAVSTKKLIDIFNRLTEFD